MVSCEKMMSSSSEGFPLHLYSSCEQVSVSLRVFININ